MITQTMLNDFKKAIKNWTHKPETQDMKAIYANDRKDLMKVYNYIKEEKYEKAYQTAYQLDTIVRDQIPNGIWNILINLDIS